VCDRGFCFEAYLGASAAIIGAIELVEKLGCGGEAGESCSSFLTCFQTNNLQAVTEAQTIGCRQDVSNLGRKFERRFRRKGREICLHELTF
jgi:hypothetical protein